MQPTATCTESDIRPVHTAITDGERNPVEYDAAYRVSGRRLASTLHGIFERHGRDICLLPISAASAGGGVFQCPAPPGMQTIGLVIEPATNPAIRLDCSPGITDIALDEIIIDRKRSEICAGASVTLEQLNHALAETVGSHYQVPGADLTSYTYAQVGSTFMTGGMGPQRRYFSDSVSEIALHDGNNLMPLGEPALRGYAGTYGWSGIVAAVRCGYHEFPEHEIAFAMPVRNHPHELARLLDALGNLCFPCPETRQMRNRSGGRDLILGLEHLTVDSMQPLLDTVDNEESRRASGLIQACRRANADGIMFVNGYSDNPIDRFLEGLVDHPDSSEPALAGISLDNAEVFSDPRQMRSLREAVPFAARTREPQGAFRYKNHTDATIRLNPDRIEQAMTSLWEANQRYVARIESFIDQDPLLEGDILVYGHMNPCGVDPHNRLTLVSDDSRCMDAAVRTANDLRAAFYRDLGRVCEQTGSVFVGGEKGADSEKGLIEAFGGLGQLPADIKDRIRYQSAAVSSASSCFNWRAPTPYRGNARIQH